MQNEVEYKIDQIKNVYVLFSLVKTGFGGYAKNYVCADKDYKVLVGIAESEGWTLYEGEEV